MSLLTETPNGLYCSAGDFYVDPWRPVDRAVVTHPHADHARPGCKHYLAAKEGHAIFRMRLGDAASIEFVDFGEVQSIGGVNVSLHPAGHMTGSAQVRLEAKGEVVVVSGDYKLQQDATCRDFEPLRCHTFITESTFGLPIYSWEATGIVAESINGWWKKNIAAGRASLLLGYTVGKAQRLLSIINPDLGPIATHGAISKACEAYRACGVKLPCTVNVTDCDKDFDWSQCLIIAPPSALGTTWPRRFGNLSTAMASGWMQVRGIRRRRQVDRGFVVSDHVDWEDLMKAVSMTQAENIWVTHGYTKQVVKALCNRGLNAREVVTKFGVDEEFEADEKTDAEPDTPREPTKGVDSKLPVDLPVDLLSSEPGESPP